MDDLDQGGGHAQARGDALGQGRQGLQGAGEDLSLGAPGVGGPDPGPWCPGPTSPGRWPPTGPRSSPRPVPDQNDDESCRDATSESFRDATNEFSLTTKHHHRSQHDHGTSGTPRSRNPNRPRMRTLRTRWPAIPTAIATIVPGPIRSAERPRAAHRAIPDFFRRPFFRQPEAAPGRVVPSGPLIERAASDRLRPWSADRPGAAPACAGCRRRPPNRRCRPADR